MKPWQATIPQPASRRSRKRCYTVWTRWIWKDGKKGPRHGGKVVWMTDAQLTFARVKYPRKEFDPVLERERLELYKKYLDQTIE